MIREKQTTINSATQPLREVVAEVKASVDLIRPPFQIFLKTFLVILVGAVPLEDQAIEETTYGMM